MTNQSKQPLIFDIKRFALDDGPGIRTTVFLKGCPLSCVWCQNPEGISHLPEVAYSPEICLKCGDCEKVCPENAVKLNPEFHLRREVCTGCGLCAKSCPTAALKTMGNYYPTEELFNILIADKSFYLASKGGVTFSGGEPTLYIDYLSKIMDKLKQNNIHLALQTSGIFNFNEFKLYILPLTDLIFFDLKIFDQQKHKKYTGLKNKKILDNLKRLHLETKARVIVRTPLIPQITDTQANLRAIETFISKLEKYKWLLLPYNPGGILKRKRLGKALPMEFPQGEILSSI